MPGITPAIRRAIWEEMQEAFKKELGGKDAGSTEQTPGPQPTTSHFSNYDLLPAAHQQSHWINAGIPLLKVAILSTFTPTEARERGEVFGALLALNIPEYVKILNEYAASIGSVAPAVTVEEFKEKMGKEIGVLENVDATKLAESKLGWSEEITKAFFGGVGEALKEN